LNAATASAATGMFSLTEAQLDTQATLFPQYVLPVDTYFKNTSLLLHADSGNGSNNNVFIDGSTNGATITRNGTTTQGTFSPFSQNGWSNYFNGSTDYLTLGGTAFQAAMATGTSSNYTVECWVYLNALPAGTSYTNVFPILTCGAIYGMWSISSTGYQMLTRSGGSYVDAAGTIPSVGVWSHLAFVNSGTSMTIYLNGTSVATASLTGTMSSGQTTRIGNNSYAYFNGYISNLRVTTTVVYTGSFTPSTTPLTAITGTILLTCQGNRIVDNSASPYTLTPSGTISVQAFAPFAPTDVYSVSSVGGSAYFNGSTDYLSVNATTYPTIKLGSGDFTLECWVYITTHRNYNTIFDCRAVTTNATGLVLAVNSSGQLYVYNNGYVLDSTSGSAATAITANAWHHIALVRSGAASGNLALYVDGARVAVSSAASSTNLSDAACTIGFGSSDNAYYFLGYISNFRMIVGTAQYSGTTYTVPTAPLTAITNTQLLLNGTNAGVFDSTARSNLITFSSAGTSTGQSKFGGSSLFFNGTSDYITSVGASNPLFSFGAGAFTIEHWCKFTATTAYINTISDNTGFTTTNNWIFMWNYAGAGRLSFWVNNGVICSTTNAYNDNAWHHVAVTRTSAGAVTIWVDGVADGTGTLSTTPMGTGAIIIGNQTGQTRYWSGYIDEIRITNGIARYTATFTPSSAAFYGQ
jgi:hypothetical protein